MTSASTMPTTAAATKPTRISCAVTTVAAAREAFGYEPLVGFEEGLKRTVDWYREAFAEQAAKGATVP